MNKFPRNVLLWHAKQLTLKLITKYEYTKVTNKEACGFVEMHQQKIMKTWKHEQIESGNLFVLYKKDAIVYIWPKKTQTIANEQIPSNVVVLTQLTDLLELNKWTNKIWKMT